MQPTAGLPCLPLVALGGVSLAIITWAAPANAQLTHVPLYTFNGDASGDWLGHSVSGAGDVDGDGRADLIVGSPSGGANGGGYARVYSGATGTTIHAFDGDSASDEFGFSVSGAGDVDGDGRVDLIVGAPRDDDTGVDSGSARVFSGATGNTIYTLNGDIEGDGQAAGDNFGYSVSGLGDINNDGRADLVVGAPRTDFNGDDSGSAYVLSGLDGSNTFRGGDGSFDDGQFGYSVSGAGFVDGDGLPDVIVGAPFTDTTNGAGSGLAQVRLGTTPISLSTFNGVSGDDSFGASVSSAGDVDGDGFDDVIVGAPNTQANGLFTGSAYVLSVAKGTTLYTFDGESEFDQFGTAVSGAGDVNGDGFADLIVGAPFDDGIGSVRVLSGIDGSELYTFYGDSMGDNFGFSVSSAGDVNGDGLADFIVGSYRGGINGGGYARVFVSVPEPGTAVSLALGAGGLLFGRRRRSTLQSGS